MGKKQPEPSVPSDVKIVLGTAAGMAATTLVHPLDVIKVRLQLSEKCRTTREIATKIVKCEGYSALLSGLDAAILRQATYTTTRLGVYSWLDEGYRKHGLKPKLRDRVMIGVYAGLAGALVGNPSEVALVRMMDDRPKEPCSKAATFEKLYRSAPHAIYKIVRNEGWCALWRGSSLTLSRSVFVSTTQITSYAHIRQGLKDRKIAKGLMLQFYASMIGGFLTAVLSLPVDLLKSRYQAKTKAQLEGEIDIYGIQNKEIAIFWKGFFPYFIRMGFHSFIAFGLFEELNIFYKHYIMASNKKR